MAASRTALANAVISASRGVTCWPGIWPVAWPEGRFFGTLTSPVVCESLLFSAVPKVGVEPTRLIRTTDFERSASHCYEHEPARSAAFAILVGAQTMQRKLLRDSPRDT